MMKIVRDGSAEIRAKRVIKALKSNIQQSAHNKIKTGHNLSA